MNGCDEGVFVCLCVRMNVCNCGCWYNYESVCLCMNVLFQTLGWAMISIVVYQLVIILSKAWHSSW